MRIEIKNKKKFTTMFNKMYNNIAIETINGIAIDSRKVMPNDIFFPIKGKNYDGHDFINNAISIGAICFSEKKTNTNKIIYTKSIIKEINSICKKWKKLSKAKIIGITGSNGKTTTKDLLHHIFKNKYSTSKTIGNFNSLIGFPISFLSTGLNDDFCILEYGASKPHEIKDLCEIINPDYSFITNISEAHIENFKSFKELFNTKIDLYKYTSDNGICFINTDNISIDKVKLKSNTIIFSLKNKPSIVFSKNKNYLKINDIHIHIPNHLIHIVDNILAAYIISKKFKINSKDINKSIESFNLPNGRGNIINFSNHNLIDDSYNANPSSVRLAINRINNINIKGKKILILGDMLELGKDSIGEHKKIASEIRKSTIDVILTYGKLSKHINKNITQSKYSKHYTSKDKLRIDLNNITCENDLIYIKGSRGMQLEKIYLNTL